MEHFSGNPNSCSDYFKPLFCAPIKADNKLKMKTIYSTAALWMLIFLVGCQSKSDHQQSENRPVKVKVMQIATSAMKMDKCFSGTVEEEKGTVLSFSVMGTVKSLHVGLGERVRKGQLIATLDIQSMQSSYNAAKASLTRAEDGYRRMKELYDKGSLPEIKWIEVQSALQQARAMEEIAAKNLKDGRLYAPYSGVIAQKSVEVGQNVVPGMAVAKLISEEWMKVKIAVPETEIAHVSLRQKATINVPALGGQTFTGVVMEKGIVANTLSRSYEVKIRLENRKSQLMPGMVTEVVLEQAETSPLCVIPASIVQLDEKNQSFVWLNEGGKAKRQIIVCGKFTANGVTVVSGLSSGDAIIIEGQQKVSEGTQIIF